MFLKLVGNELYKILRQKRLYIFLFLPLLFSFIMVYSQNKWNTNNPGKLQPIYASGNTFQILDNIMAFVAFFYAIMVVSFFLAEDYAEGTLKLTLMRPVSRFLVLNSKIVAFYLSVLMFFTSVFLFIFLTGYYFGSPEEFMVFSNSEFKEFQGISIPFWEGVRFLATCYLLCTVGVFVLGLIFFLFGTLSGKPSVAITLSIALFIACYLYMAVMSNTPYIKYNIWSQFFLYKPYYIEKWNLPVNEVYGTLKQNLKICLIYAAIAYPLTAAHFCRKSILR